VVTDKGQMIADNTDPDDSTTGPPPPVIIADTATGNAADDADVHVDVPSVFISADVVMNMKKKSA